MIEFIIQVEEEDKMGRFAEHLIVILLKSKKTLIISDEHKFQDSVYNLTSYWDFICNLQSNVIFLSLVTVKDITGVYLTGCLCVICRII